MSIDRLDTKHEITDFGKGIELHRFKNSTGDPYSAIYINSAEIYSCDRENESEMLNFFMQREGIYVMSKIIELLQENGHD